MFTNYNKQEAPLKGKTSP